MVKKLYRQKKRAKKEERVSKIEDYYKKKEIRNFYREIKKGRQSKSQMLFVKDKDQNLIGDDAKIKERWKEYFCELLNEDGENLSVELEKMGETGEVVSEPTRLELDDIIEKLKNNKSSGENGITAEHIKFGGEDLREKLYHMVIQIWRQEKMPKNWEKANIIPILKHGDTADCKNYRGISLLDVVYKIVATLIKIKLEPFIEAQLGEYQAGFRKGRGTTDQVFTMKEILTNCYEYKVPVEVLFIDFKRAYDSVNRNGLIKILEWMGIPMKLTNLVKMTLTNTRCNVKIWGDTSEDFVVKAGLRQGDPLSTVLFNLVLEKIVSEAQLNRNDHILYKSHQVIGYADDVALIARDTKELTQITRRIIEAASKVGLHINQEKSKWMRLGAQRSDNWEKLEVSSQMGKMKFEEVQEFVYLGALISSKCEEEKEIEARLLKANRCAGSINHLLRSKELSRRAKIKLYKTVLLPTALYSCETWVLNKAMEEKLRRWERKMIRRIMGGKKTEDGYVRRTNDEIYELYQDPKIDAVVKARRLQWLGHIERMEDHRIAKRIAWEKPEGRRKRGRPKKRWREAVMADLKEKGIHDWRSIVKDRKLWKNITKLWA